MLLKPNEDRTHLTSQIYPMGGRICLTSPACHDSGTRWGQDMSGWLDISNLGLDMSDRA
jgi:hypothetical protein